MVAPDVAAPPVLSAAPFSCVSPNTFADLEPIDVDDRDGADDVDKGDRGIRMPRTIRYRRTINCYEPVWQPSGTFVCQYSAKVVLCCII